MPDKPTVENLSPRIPRSTFEKENGSNASITPLSPPEIPQGEEEREELSDSSDVSACSATYSNLGKHFASHTSINCSSMAVSSGVIVVACYHFHIDNFLYSCV